MLSGLALPQSYFLLGLGWPWHGGDSLVLVLVGPRQWRLRRQVPLEGRRYGTLCLLYYPDVPGPVMVGPLCH